MAAAKQLIRQFDFSAGELVEHAKRSDDDKIVRAGLRQARNARILNTGKLENRMGRTALFGEPGRVDKVRIDSSTTFYLCFGQGTLRIRDSTGAISAARGGLPWDTDTVDEVVWTLVTQAFNRSDVVICFSDGSRPLVARWNGSAWSFFKFAFTADGRGIEKVPFYRVAAPGATLAPSNETGSITLVASESVFVANHVRSLIRFANRRVRVTGYTSGTQVSGTVLDFSLYTSWNLVVPDATGFLVGEIVEGATSGATAEITAINYSSGAITGQKLAGTDFITGGVEYLVGPNARVSLSTAGSNADPAAAVSWDEPMVSDARGWPRSCSTDQGRLIFTDIPSVPNAVLWSATTDPYDFQIGTEPNQAMAELIAGNPRIYHVIGGADQFVFTNQGVFYIPISESNPLQPGSVTFRRITSDAAARLRPASSSEALVFANQGLNRVIAIVPTGQTAQPYITRDMSQVHSHLLSSPVALAVTTADDVAERYVFAVNDDGTLAVGRFDPGKEWVGWVPWEGDGEVTWVSASGSTVLFTTDYDPTSICEVLDTAAYMDTNVPLNSIPSALGDGVDTEILMFYGAGTVIGDMIDTTTGGNIAAFDDTTSSTAANSAGVAAALGYVGKTLGTAQAITKAEIWPSSNSGFADGGSGNVSLTLYGKQGSAPANSTDGTSLGTLSIADTTTGPQTITSSDQTTLYDHLWVRIAMTSASAVYAAELRFYTPGLTRKSASLGTGDFWFLAGKTVDVMLGRKYLGTRSVTAAGDLTTVEGEDLSDSDVRVGLDWDLTIEPFVPHAGQGQSFGQTLHQRNVRGAVAVQNSTGFTVAGAVATPYRKGDNEDDEPELREEVVPFSVQGADYDPRFELTKPYPGPLRVLEISMEVDV